MEKGGGRSGHPWQWPNVRAGAMQQTVDQGQERGPWKGIRPAT